MSKPTSAPPREFGGVVFRCYHVGIDRYEWRTDDGQIVVARVAGRYTYLAIVEGVRLTTRFRTTDGAMRAGVKALKK
jgi:hypothetical protein